MLEKKCSHGAATKYHSVKVLKVHDLYPQKCYSCIKHSQRFQLKYSAKIVINASFFMLSTDRHALYCTAMRAPGGMRKRINVPFYTYSVPRYHNLH